MGGFGGTRGGREVQSDPPQPRMAGLPEEGVGDWSEPAGRRAKRNNEDEDAAWNELPVRPCPPPGLTPPVPRPAAAMAPTPVLSLSALEPGGFCLLRGRFLAPHPLGPSSWPFLRASSPSPTPHIRALRVPYLPSS